MRIKLPDGERVILPGHLSYEERMVYVQDILDKFEDYFYNSWTTRSTKIALDTLGTYLSRAKDFKVADYTVASVRESAAMHGKRWSNRYVNFSDLPNSQKYKMGIRDYGFDDAYE